MDTQPNSFDNALRKYSTQATTALGIVIAVTGVMLFFHVAKGQVEEMHEWLGMAFIVVAALHVIRHRAAFMGMLNQPRMRALFAATAVIAVIFLLTAETEKKGNPFRDAGRLMTQASLTELAPVVKVPVDQLARRVGASDPNQSLESIARAHNTHPMRLLEQALSPKGADHDDDDD